MKVKAIFLLFFLFALAPGSMGQDAGEHSKPHSEKAAPAKTPSVSAILANYVKAIGGREAVEKQKSRSYTGKVLIPQAGVSGTLEAHAMPEAMSVVIMEIPGIGVFSEGYNGKTGWGNDPMTGYREKSGEELSRQKLLALFYRDIELEKIYSKAELTGVEAVNGEDAYVINLSNPGMAPDVMYFDTKSGLLVRQDSVAVSPAGRVPTVSMFSDYREVDGVKIAFRALTKLPQFDLVITLDQVKHNVALDPKIFAPPTK